MQLSTPTKFTNHYGVYIRIHDDICVYTLKNQSMGSVTRKKSLDMDCGVE